MFFVFLSYNINLPLFEKKLSIIGIKLSIIGIFINFFDLKQKLISEFNLQCIENFVKIVDFRKR
jgi:hypothetical protein